MTMKLPAIHLYPGDWLRDAVAGCSIAAQGLWLRMMFLMHDSERYGYLVVNGSAMPSESIARRCGCTPTEYETLLTELDASGVPSRTQDSIIYSRRMVRDATERANAAERQRRFKSHAGGNGKGNGKVTGESHESNNPSSSSVSTSKKETALRAATPPESTAHKRLFSALQDRAGPISDGAAQGKAIKWLLSHFDEKTCVECLDALRKEDWRTTRVSWLTVQKEIGAWLTRRAAPPKERGLVL